MGNKIIVEFDRKDLEGKCRTCLKYKYSIENNKNYCSRTDDDLINCNLIFSSPYKIKEKDDFATKQLEYNERNTNYKGL